ncbi:MAG: hypothetical protein KF884_06220 [Fimbriimonadaceae bacterium]|nr:hypothetical protein [Fimbriimonadaceae bacterium]QYK59680.1 MAG: hypothetical protein KF884_06220 [Fimbriimonadaceae bacterium]
MEAVVFAYQGDQPKYVKELEAIRGQEALSLAVKQHGSTLVVLHRRGYIFDKSLRADLAYTALNGALREIIASDDHGVVAVSKSPSVRLLVSLTMNAVMRLEELDNANVTILPSTMVRLTDGDRSITVNIEPEFPEGVKSRLLESPVKLARTSGPNSSQPKDSEPFFDPVRGVEIMSFGKGANNRFQRMEDLKAVVDQLYNWHKEAREEAGDAIQRFFVSTEGTSPSPGLDNQIGKNVGDLDPKIRDQIRAKIEGQTASLGGAEAVSKFLGNARIESVAKIPILVVGRLSPDGLFNAIVFGLTPP